MIWALLAFGVLMNAHATTFGETKRYALVIHGGAGSTPKDADWRENRQKVFELALSTGKAILESGGNSLDAVEEVIRILEDSPYFNAGKGAVFNAAGGHELDATIMNGMDRSCGAVGGVSTIRNPISLARKVMTQTRHVLLATDGAEVFANDFKDDPKIERVPNSYFSTEHQKLKLEKAQQAERMKDRDAMGTVGCVALDQHGNIAAGTSTGGLVNKKYGRLGDSPIAGAGTFADNTTCGVSCTGVGEDFIRNAVAYDVSARMEYQASSLKDALHAILHHPHRQVRGGIIAIDKNGTIEMQFNTEGMARAALDSSGRWEIHLAE